MASLQEKLDKIKSPKLQNQHTTAIVLSAVEDTLREQHTDCTATAYFAALLALLGQSVSSTQGLVEKEPVTSVVYLLDIVSPFVPAPLLRAKFAQILGSLAPVLVAPAAEAPLLRPSIGCLQSLLVAQDAAAWALPHSQIGPRRAMAGLLALAVDHRPKVRKRAQDALAQVLKHPPPSPSLDHPAADMCAETALLTLKESVAAAGKMRKGKHASSHQNQHEPAVIHALHLVKTLATASGGWPSKKIEPLCELLMNVSRSTNEFLTMGAFEVFEVIFEGMADDFSSSKLPRLLEAIRELKPAHNDSQLLPPWIAVLSRGYDVSAQVHPEDTFEQLPELFDLVASFLSSSSHNIRISASECLVSFLANCIPASVIVEPSIYDEKTLEKLAKTGTGLLSMKYQTAWAEVFNVLTAMFEALKWRADPILTDIVRTIGGIRGNDSFHGKKEADKVLGAAVEAMGPETILGILPLNITRQKAGEPGRVWLLPILRDYVSNTRLSYFRSEFVPLSESLFQKVLEYGNAEKTVEVKIFETLVQQTWATLPGFCVLPLDVIEAFDQGFAELLSNVLYKQTELRVDVCKALQNLVEGNKEIASLEQDADDLVLQRRITKKMAKKNIAHLAALSSNLLAVLFNVYSQTLPQFRGYILQCINAYLSITPEKELMETFTRVTTMLQASLEETAQEQAKKKNTGDKMPPTSHTLMDLVVTMSIYLPRVSFATLFSLSAVVLNTESLDPQLIKKAYKLIPRLATAEAGALALEERSSDLQSLIISTTDKTPSPARRDRLMAIQEIVTHLPTSDLHFIPSILSEVVLGCKESNEKARTAAFSLLIHLANRLTDAERNPLGTVIRNSLISHMADDAPDAPATIEEFFTMVSAGLAGSSPHMVAASVIALSRLLFEFHSSLPRAVLSDLVQTIDLFLTSNNREIVRAVLGFVKVVVVAIPDDLLKPRLESLVPNLMVWSKEHKGRLRSKVKGILDRLMRRFGAQAVESFTPESDRKLVVAIRKQRERSKRKKEQSKAAAEDESGAEEGGPSTTRNGFSNEFDKAVYGSDMSDSDMGSDSDDDASEIEIDAAGNMHKHSNKAKKAAPQNSRSKPSKASKDSTGSQYIRELSPESNPLDLLAPNTLASISSTKPTVRFLHAKKTTAHRRSARVDADGKLILSSAGAGAVGRDADGDTAMAEGADASAVDAYIAAVSGPDAVRKGQKGRLKVGQSGVGKKGGAAAAAAESDEEGEAGKEKKRGGHSSGRRGLGEPKRSGGGGGGAGRVEKRRNFKAGRSGSGFRRKR
ncbi:pre-rRNA processing protein [Ophidiomyces ophidiicola]|nr:pre-rRNA processing protein [Ophidiomyces ophidiicola]KAI2005484.1 pre-rRNA processing protein [Ophidiomyces ophidiicola]KAI2023128.1 pre-rRNA processing protein [Ophidiomyces ophidiicola]KAI2051850.1 pre-rRNA processing protein [Ophidiomyces ophidiicola]KAI2077051.1 pre-rRNA processing protein [Ophidiomyces ophidiicola]